MHGTLSINMMSKYQDLHKLQVHDIENQIDDDPIVKSHLKKHSLIFGVIPNQRQVVKNKLKKMYVTQAERARKYRRKKSMIGENFLQPKLQTDKSEFLSKPQQQLISDYKDFLDQPKFELDFKPSKSIVQIDSFLRQE